MKKRLLVIFVFIFFQVFCSDLSADISWKDESSFYKPIILYKGKDEMKSVDDRLMNWIKSNVSSKTLLPLSFCISKEQKNAVYGNMGEADSVSCIIERIIVE